MSALSPVRVSSGGEPPEGARPYRFTVHDVRRMLATGIVDPDANVELIGGELFLMPSEGELHVWVKNTISHAIYDRIPRSRYVVMTDSTLELSEESTPDPDIYVAEGVSPRSLINASQVRLIIEVADSSVAGDLGQKAVLYAQHEIPEYWVVDAQLEQTHVMRRPVAGSYVDTDLVPYERPLEALAIPELRLQLSELPGLRSFGA